MKVGWGHRAPSLRHFLANSSENAVRAAAGCELLRGASCCEVRVAAGCELLRVRAAPVVTLKNRRMWCESGL